MDFRPGCHRVQRQVQFREQTNYYEGSRVLYTHTYKPPIVLAFYLPLQVTSGCVTSPLKVGPWSVVTWLEYQKSRQVALSPFSLSHSVSGRSSTWQPILFLSPPRSNQTGGWIMFPCPLTSTKLLETKTKKWSIMLSFAPWLLFCPVLLTLIVISCSTLKTLKIYEHKRHKLVITIRGFCWINPI